MRRAERLDGAVEKPERQRGVLDRQRGGDVSACLCDQRVEDD